MRYNFQPCNSKTPKISSKGMVSGILKLLNLVYRQFLSTGYPFNNRRHP
jgi:hypothetical protein